MSTFSVKFFCISDLLDCLGLSSLKDENLFQMLDLKKKKSLDTQSCFYYSEPCDLISVKTVWGLFGWFFKF